VFDTTTTDANGPACLKACPGDYAIEVVLPATGYIRSPGRRSRYCRQRRRSHDRRTIVTTLIPDEQDLTWDAGLTPRVDWQPDMAITA
jgi:hypothetical protein